ncbi:TetR/AcrR family transcriptional regulator [Nocardia sp. CY41]|uniref:TetR/AcrR family transcriptional regulator n=1 Tax=Nocardia sp. CY41 TaxID=2608686 RepID=UPI0013598E23|nr:TetR/AcrR family transcriptional regulator [Nocardia sp. CY41]
MDTEEGIHLPRTAELIAQLTRDYGTEYTMVLTRAIDDANHDDQVSYKRGLNTAIALMAVADGDGSKAAELTIGHVESFLVAIRADLQAFSHRGGTLPDLPPSKRPRAERKRRTRQRLVHAAAELLLIHGYPATSIDRIAEHADLTSGEFFAHFNHKQQIAHDVADNLTRHALRRIHRFHPRDADQLVTTLARWAYILITRPGWIRLELELAERDKQSRADVICRRDQLHEAVRKLLTSTSTSTSTHDPSTDLDITVSFLLSTVVGMASPRAGDFDVTPATTRRRIELVLHAAGFSFTPAAANRDQPNSRPRSVEAKT